MTDRVIKLPAFLLSAAIWSHMAHSLPVINYKCTKNTKHLEMYEYIIHYILSNKTTPSFFKRFIFRVCFIRLGCDMHLSKFTWK